MMTLSTSHLRYKYQGPNTPLLECFDNTLNLFKGLSSEQLLHMSGFYFVDGNREKGGRVVWQSLYLFMPVFKYMLNWSWLALYHHNLNLQSQDLDFWILLFGLCNQILLKYHTELVMVVASKQFPPMYTSLIQFCLPLGIKQPCQPLLLMTKCIS